MCFGLLFWLLLSSHKFFDSTVGVQGVGHPKARSLLQPPASLLSCLQLPQAHPLSGSHFLHVRQGLQSLQVNLFLPVSNKHSTTCNSYQTHAQKKKLNKYFTQGSLLYRESSILGQENLINSGVGNEPTRTGVNQHYFSNWISV